MALTDEQQEDIKSLINENKVSDIEEIIKVMKKFKKRVDNINRLCKSIKEENFGKPDEKDRQKYLKLDGDGKNLCDGCLELNKEIYSNNYSAIFKPTVEEDVEDILCITYLHNSLSDIYETQEEEDDDNGNGALYAGSQKKFNLLKTNIKEFYEAYNYMISAAAELLPAKRIAEQKERNAEKRKR